jgi:glycosyltransferase involved in cell wall biosynthesis
MVCKAYVAGAYHGKLREMVNLGVDVTLIVPPRWGNQTLEIRNAREYKIRISHCLLSGHNHFYFYSSGVGEIDADLVYIEEEPWSLVTHQFMRACAKQRKPAVFYTYQNIYKHYPPPFNYFEAFSYKYAKAGFAGNEEAAHILRQRGFSRPIAVVPQVGVDPDVFYRQPNSLRAELGLEDKFVVGFAGRIIKSKGISDLIRALPLLPERCVLVLLGSGAFESGARQLAADLGVSPRMRWVPDVSSLRVAEWMNAFDVLVLPSRTTQHWKEQFGRVLIEAMACETPVIGSSSAEIPRVIGDAGLVFPEGDFMALADRLRNVYQNENLARRLGSKGRGRVLEHFTHRRIAEKTVGVLAEVLQLPNPESVPRAAPFSRSWVQGPRHR